MTRTWEHASNTHDVIKHVNPAHPAETATYPTSTAEDIDAAVSAARVAQRAWGRTIAVRRADALNAIAQSLRARADALARTMLQELGKPLPDGLGEVANAASVFEYYAAVLITRNEETSRALGSSDRLATLRYPLGVVAAITPWNFPVNIAAVKLAPALAFGNGVVLKPSPHAVATSKALFDALYEADTLPRGLAGLVHGPFAGEALIRHADVDGVTFTGSTAVGRRVMLLAAQRNIPYQCEMGGNNAVVVLADAPIDRAIELVVDGAFRLAGQRCTATRRVIVEDSVYDEFRERLIKAAAAVRFGDPADSGVLVGPLINAESLDRVANAVSEAVAAGAKVLVGGDRACYAPDSGYVYRPTVLELATDAPILKDEVFGPVLSLQSATSLENAIQLVNATPYGLAAAICTASLSCVQQFIDGVEAGAVSVNGSTAGWQYQVPFGGWKASGAGVPEQGTGVERFFTRQKTVRVQWVG